MSEFSIEEYLTVHTIVKIGVSPPEFVCYDTIVDSPEDFVSVVQRSMCYICTIRWWEHATINHGAVMGYGGPRDPRNPEDTYFAETDIWKEFHQGSSAGDYLEYMRAVKQAYSDLELYPAFDIKHIT